MFSPAVPVVISKQCWKCSKNLQSDALKGQKLKVWTSILMKNSRALGLMRLCFSQNNITIFGFLLLQCNLSFKRQIVLQNFVQRALNFLRICFPNWRKYRKNHLMKAFQIPFIHSQFLFAQNFDTFIGKKCFALYSIESRIGTKPLLRKWTKNRIFLYLI